MNFDQFDLHPNIARGIKSVGYENPTPIQEKAIPQIIAGHDLIGLAQTGTGKTAAFALPVLQRLIDGRRGCVRALVVSPTRELAEQTYDVFCMLGRFTGLRCAAIYGGVPMGPQKAKIKSGVEIIIACPGRLLDHIWQCTIDLATVEILALDEADRMCDMGFMPDIRNILRCMPENRQTLFFSATMPADIRKLSGDMLKKPVTVKIGHAAPANTVSHAIYPVQPQLKTKLLKEILRKVEMESVLIFARTKSRTRRLSEDLGKAGYKVVTLQGDMPQSRRKAALEAFRRGTTQILVATDVAARGLDILQISHVINYDMPDTADAYTHRIGRTGRISQTGDAFTLVTYEDDAMVRTIEGILGEKLERRKMPGFDSSPPPRQAPPRRSPARRFPARQAR